MVGSLSRLGRMSFLGRVYTPQTPSSPPPDPIWILATNFWNDEGIWLDTSVWKD